MHATSEEPPLYPVYSLRAKLTGLSRPNEKSEHRRGEEKMVGHESRDFGTTCRLPFRQMVVDAIFSSVMTTWHSST